MGNDAFRMKSKTEIVVNPESFYFLRKRDVMYGFMNDRQLYKILSDKKNEIRQYIRSNLLNTNNEFDLIRVIKYYNTLIK